MTDSIEFLQAELIKRNAEIVELKAELKRVKCCKTCKNYDRYNFICLLHGKCKNHNLWEL